MMPRVTAVPFHFLTSSETAALLGLTQPTFALRVKLRPSECPAYVKIGERSMRFDPAVVEAWMRQNCPERATEFFGPEQSSVNG
jgi:predicted DNA-binding transcriptional regulator AlpA